MVKYPLHNIVVVGAVDSEQGSDLASQGGWTSETLVLSAVRGALVDAGLKPTDIDGVTATGRLWQSSRLICQVDRQRQQDDGGWF